MSNNLIQNNMSSELITWIIVSILIASTIGLINGSIVYSLLSKKMDKKLDLINSKVTYHLSQNQNEALVRSYQQLSQEVKDGLLLNQDLLGFMQKELNEIEEKLN
ncbi:MAG: hypothetical protein ACRCXZ_02135 [Patescibacteria group bacterium]